MDRISPGVATRQVEDLLVEKFSAKGRNLNEKLRSAGRRLPRRIKNHARYLAEVEARHQNPRHAHEYDARKVGEAWKQCVSHLEKIDRRSLASYRRLGWLTGTLVNMFLLALLFALVMHKVGLAGVAGRHIGL